MVGADFMATAIFIVAKFKSVQCRSAGQRLALILRSAPASKRIFFTDRHGKERIEPQKIMIVAILVACGHAPQGSPGMALCLFSLPLGGCNGSESGQRGTVGIAGSRRITPGTKSVPSALSHSKCKPRGPDSCAARSKTDCQKQTAPQSQRK